MFLGLGAEPVYSHYIISVSILIFYRGIARSLWSGYIIPMRFHCAGGIIYVLLCEAQSACIACMLMLVGLGHAPRKVLKNRCAEIESKGNIFSYTMYINL